MGKKVQSNGFRLTVCYRLQQILQTSLTF